MALKRKSDGSLVDDKGRLIARSPSAATSYQELAQSYPSGTQTQGAAVQGQSMPASYSELVSSLGNSSDYAANQLTLSQRYAEDIKKMTTDAADKGYNNAVSWADFAKSQSEKDAEITKERGIVDADTAYRRALAEHGNNAEALSQMGLSGSGYSEYLNSKAYSQKMSDKQAVNAEHEAALRSAEYQRKQALAAANNAKDQAYLNAELQYMQNMHSSAMSYQEYLLQKQAEEKADASTKAANSYNSYASLLESAISGQFTGEEMKALASKQGDYLSEQDISDLESKAQAAYDKASSEKNNSTYLSLYSTAVSGEISYDDMKSLALKSGLTDADSEAIAKIAKNAYDKTQQAIKDQNAASAYGSMADSTLAAIANGTVDAAKAKEGYYNEILNNIKSDYSTVDVSDIMKAYNPTDPEKSLLTEAQFNELKAEFSASVSANLMGFFTNAQGGTVTRAKAERILSAAESNELIDDATEGLIKKIFSETYKTTTKGFGKSNGNNFKLSLCGETYELETISEVCANSDECANYFGEKWGALPGVFVYKNKVYVKQKGGKVYQAGDRGGKNTGVTNRLILSGMLPALSGGK